jgi:cytochrome c-type biogenesis protein CcmF
MGTFIVRSGVLTSVHSFAVDPARGVFILSILMLFTGGALTLFAVRAKELRQGGMFSLVSREGALVLNNVLLVVSAGAVFVGTLYPLALEGLTGEKISVGPPFFNWTFGPIMVALLTVLPLGAMLAWKRGDLARISKRVLLSVAAGLAAALLVYALMHRGPMLAPLGIALGAYVMAGSLIEWLQRIKLGEAGFDEVLRRARNLPRSSYGTLLAHSGIGMMMVGITATSAYQVERILVMKPNDKVDVAGYELTFKGAVPTKGPNYREDIATIEVTREGSPVTVLYPSKRVYDMPPQPTTEAGIHASWRGDLYAVIGDEQMAGGAYAVRAYFNPLVRFIWIGAVIMFMGGLASLSDRRLRVGAPVKAKGKVVAAE